MRTERGIDSETIVQCASKFEIHVVTVKKIVQTRFPKDKQFSNNTKNKWTDSDHSLKQQFILILFYVELVAI